MERTKYSPKKLSPAGVVFMELFHNIIETLSTAASFDCLITVTIEANGYGVTCVSSRLLGCICLKIKFIKIRNLIGLHIV